MPIIKKQQQKIVKKKKKIGVVKDVEKVKSLFWVGPKIHSDFFHNILWKNPSKILGQPCHGCWCRYIRQDLGKSFHISSFFPCTSQVFLSDYSNFIKELRIFPNV